MLKKQNPAHKAWITRRTKIYKRKKAGLKGIITRKKTGGHSKKAQALKFEVFSHYSKGEPKCACCGEDASLDFLTIDHMKGRKVSKNKPGNSGRREMINEVLNPCKVRIPLWWSSKFPSDIIM